MAQIGCFLMTLYFLAHIIRMAGLRWYDRLVALCGIATIALGAATSVFILRKILSPKAAQPYSS